MTFDLTTIDWTAVYALVVAIMIILTVIAIIAAFRSNAQAKKANIISEKTLEELIDQRENAERPLITVGLDVNPDNKTAYFIISNHGNRPADKISVSFDENFLNALDDKGFKSKIKLFLSSEFDLVPQQSYKIYFANFGDDVINRNADIQIDCSYEWYKSGGVRGQERSRSILNLSNYFWLGEIWKNKNNQPIDRIAASLDKIEKSIASITQVDDSDIVG